MDQLCEDRYIDEDKVRQAQAYLVDSLSATRLSEIFKALSDPSRVRIISALTHTELCVYDLAAALGMSQSAVSHQLRSLREMRLVRYRKEGRHVYYQLDDEHIGDLFRRGLEHVEHS
ncbi:MAG: helix-turn-helix transcriptional regulator [Anaerolineales bacterium]|nr:MAG: helix-turn-helix transcriptional regulator [Anaerolineales bacterium]